MRMPRRGAAPRAGERGRPLRVLGTYVRPEWIDYNGHMTDSRYLQVFGDAMDALYRRVGIDEAYRGRGAHVLHGRESHLVHAAEARVGEPLEVTTRVLAVDDKRLRVVPSPAPRQR